MDDYVILVNERDEALGVREKLQAHRDGALHRAFSVFIFNDDGALLLQRRHPAKYHSGGLWSNACCGHPRPGEDVREAAERRLGEELGFSVTLEPRFTLLYKEKVSDGLLEHELDHVLAGRFNGTPTPNADEVDAWRWVAPGRLASELAERPEAFTVWFRRIQEERGR